jgi:selenocysteine-specific elongation factor
VSTSPGTAALPGAAHGGIVIGTAGHIDHGKTALVRCLTGQDTDRLKEERERGISIDLGFAYLDDGDRRYGVVDVPGHERFIRNMLAGAHGIDLVLVVVAADDGVMPQTEEHFDIVHLLGVRRGIFVITKVDLVDESRVREVCSDIEVLACGTAFEEAPVVAVSSATGEGIDALRSEIARQIAGLSPRELHGLFRLPIDRAFAMHGHGLVVTGTAVAGVLREGDPLALRPGDRQTRARTIQVHGQKVSEARAGQRVAVNLAGLERGQAERGQVLADPRLEFTTDRFDCWLEVRSGAKRPLKSFDGIRVYSGTAETMARAIVLGDAREIAPKSSGFCQVVLDDPLLLVRGDRFIVRTEAATRTTGGGIVLHAFAPRHRSSEADLLSHLTALRDDGPPARLHAFLELLQEFVAPASYLAQGLAGTPEEIREAADAAPGVVALPSDADPQAYTTRSKWNRLGKLVVDVLRHFHATHPLASGMELESVRSRLRVAVPPKLFRPIVERLEVAGLVTREDSLLRLPSHRVELRESEADDADRVRRAIAAGGLTPPDTKQLETELRLPAAKLLQLLGVLDKRGEIVRVAADLYYEVDALARARQIVVDQLRERPEITVAEYRTLISGSRKYALALLDHFDRSALTIRVGDARRLRRT